MAARVTMKIVIFGQKWTKNAIVSLFSFVLHPLRYVRGRCVTAAAVCGGRERAYVCLLRAGWNFTLNYQHVCMHILYRA